MVIIVIIGAAFIDPEVTLVGQGINIGILLTYELNAGFELSDKRIFLIDIIGEDIVIIFLGYFYRRDEFPPAPVDLLRISGGENASSETYQ